jgi:hypothetical protein
MTLLSNSTYITPKIKKGVNNVQMVLVVNGISLINGNPTVSFTDSGITATVVTTGIVSYAIPGNSYPGNYQTVTINVNKTPNLATGVQGVYITNAGQDQSQPMTALLEIF